ncbi:MAG: hypothetical protein ABW069_06650, partial [Duganella sp.]
QDGFVHWISWKVISIYRSETNMLPKVRGALRKAGKHLPHELRRAGKVGDAGHAVDNLGEILAGFCLKAIKILTYLKIFFMKNNDLKVCS